MATANAFSLVTRAMDQLNSEHWTVVASSTGKLWESLMVAGRWGTKEWVGYNFYGGFMPSLFVVDDNVLVPSHVALEFVSWKSSLAKLDTAMDDRLWLQMPRKLFEEKSAQSLPLPRVLSQFDGLDLKAVRLLEPDAARPITVRAAVADTVWTFQLDPFSVQVTGWNKPPLKISYGESTIPVGWPVDSDVYDSKDLVHSPRSSLPVIYKDPDIWVGRNDLSKSFPWTVRSTLQMSTTHVVMNLPSDDLLMSTVAARAPELVKDIEFDSEMSEIFVYARTKKAALVVVAAIRSFARGDHRMGAGHTTNEATT